jgi:hypothetical protein
LDPIGKHSGIVEEETMSKFKIERGVSRLARVKLQASIEESIAADLLLMSEWSNNDKNYIVNELLRFALSQEAEFQAHKESLGWPRRDLETESTAQSPKARATSASDSGRL